MTALTIAGFAITFLTKVVGLDVSIHQLVATETVQTTQVTVAQPAAVPNVSLIPPCTVMTGKMNETDLNKIELARATGSCK